VVVGLIFSTGINNVVWIFHFMMNSKGYVRTVTERKDIKENIVQMVENKMW
jgi:hypothetical protein